MALSPDNLVGLYYAQGEYTDAELLFKCVLAIEEKALGPDHPEVAASLGNYAALLRKTGRDVEAAKLEARTEAIRAGRAKENPAN